jgi:hypothetical protein
MPLPSFPFLCTESTNLLVSYLVDASALQALTPARLRVVELFPGRTILGLACIEYRQTSVGPYNEVGISWPVIPASEPAFLAKIPVLPLVAASVWPGFGWWVHQLPVTTVPAMDAGKQLWGYPKTLANISFGWNGPSRTCRLEQGGDEVLNLSVDARLFARPQQFTQRTYTLLGANLMQTQVHFEGTGGGKTLIGQCHLTLGPHPWARQLAPLNLETKRPISLQWFPVWRASLPAPQSKP